MMNGDKGVLLFQHPWDDFILQTSFLHLYTSFLRFIAFISFFLCSRGCLCYCVLWVHCYTSLLAVMVQGTLSLALFIIKLTAG